MCMLGRYDLKKAHEEGSAGTLWSLTFLFILNGRLETYHADILIIVLFNKIMFRDTIQTVCLPKSSHGEFSGLGKVIGWKKSEYSASKRFI